MLKEERKAVNEMVFGSDEMEIQDVIVALREIQVVASTSANPFTLVHLVIFGMQIFRKSGVFEHSCREWKKIPPTEQTLTNFATHFQEEHRE